MANFQHPGLKLLFCDSFAHEQAGEHTESVVFSENVVIKEYRVVPMTMLPHANMPPKSTGCTTPSTFLLDIYSKNVVDKRFERSVERFQYQEDVSDRIVPMHKDMVTDQIVIRGNYAALTLCVYGWPTNGHPPPAMPPHVSPAVVPMQRPPPGPPPNLNPGAGHLHLAGQGQPQMRAQHSGPPPMAHRPAPEVTGNFEPPKTLPPGTVVPPQPPPAVPTPTAGPTSTPAAAAAAPAPTAAAAPGDAKAAASGEPKGPSRFDALFSMEPPMGVHVISVDADLIFDPHKCSFAPPRHLQFPTSSERDVRGALAAVERGTGHFVNLCQTAVEEESPLNRIPLFEEMAKVMPLRMTGQPQFAEAATFLDALVDLLLESLDDSTGLTELKAALDLVEVLFKSDLPFADKFVEGDGLELLYDLLSSPHTSSLLQRRVLQVLRTALAHRECLDRFVTVPPPPGAPAKSESTDGSNVATAMDEGYYGGDRTAAVGAGGAETGPTDRAAAAAATVEAAQPTSADVDEASRSDRSRSGSREREGSPAEPRTPGDADATAADRRTPPPRSPPRSRLRTSKGSASGGSSRENSPDRGGSREGSRESTPGRDVSAAGSPARSDAAHTTTETADDPARPEPMEEDVKSEPPPPLVKVESREADGGDQSTTVAEDATVRESGYQLVLRMMLGAKRDVRVLQLCRELIEICRLYECLLDFEQSVAAIHDRLEAARNDRYDEEPAAAEEGSGVETITADEAARVIEALAALRLALQEQQSDDWAGRAEPDFVRSSINRLTRAPHIGPLADLPPHAVPLLQASQLLPLLSLLLEKFGVATGPDLDSEQDTRDLLESSEFIGGSGLRVEGANASQVHLVVFGAIRDVLLQLLSTRGGVFALASQPEGLLRSIIESLHPMALHEPGAAASEQLVPQPSAVPPFIPCPADELASLPYCLEAPSKCSAPHLAHLIIYHVQALVELDALVAAVAAGPDKLVPVLRSLYSMTFHDMGKQAVVAALAQPDGIACLLSLLEVSPNDADARNSVVVQYAVALLLMIIQHERYAGLVVSFGAAMFDVVTRLEVLSLSTDVKGRVQQIHDWLRPALKFKEQGASGVIASLASYLPSADNIVAPPAPPPLVPAPGAINGPGLPPGAGPAVLTQQGPLAELPLDAGAGHAFSRSSLISLTSSLQLLDAAAADSPTLATTLYSADVIPTLKTIIEECGKALGPQDNGAAGTSKASAHIKREQLHLRLLVPALNLLRCVISGLHRARLPVYRNTPLAKSLLKLQSTLSQLPQFNGTVPPFSASGLTLLVNRVESALVGVLSVWRWPAIVPLIVDELWLLPRNFIGGSVLLLSLMPPLLDGAKPARGDARDELSQWATRADWIAELSKATPKLTTAVSLLLYTSCRPQYYALLGVMLRLVDLSAELANKVVVGPLVSLVEEVYGKMDFASGPPMEENVLVRLLHIMLALARTPLGKAALLHNKAASRLLPMLTAVATAVLPPRLAGFAFAILFCLCQRSPQPLPGASEALAQAEDAPTPDELSRLVSKLLGLAVSAQVPVSGTAMYVLMALSNSSYGAHHILQHTDGEPVAGEAAAPSTKPPMFRFLARLQQMCSQCVTTQLKELVELTVFLLRQLCGPEGYRAAAVKAFMAWDNARADFHPLVQLLHALDAAPKQVEEEGPQALPVQDVRENLDFLIGQLREAEPGPAPPSEPTSFPPPRSLEDIFAARDGPGPAAAAAVDRRRLRPPVGFVPAALDPVLAALVNNYETLGLLEDNEFEDLVYPPAGFFKDAPEGQPGAVTLDQKRGAPAALQSAAKRARTGAEPGSFTQFTYGTRRDHFRLRRPNTSRPPSVHVDVFQGHQGPSVVAPMPVVLPPRVVPQPAFVQFQQQPMQPFAGRRGRKQWEDRSAKARFQPVSVLQAPLQPPRPMPQDRSRMPPMPQPPPGAFARWPDQRGAHGRQGQPVRPGFMPGQPIAGYAPQGLPQPRGDPAFYPPGYGTAYGSDRPTSRGQRHG